VEHLQLQAKNTSVRQLQIV